MFFEIDPIGRFFGTDCLWQLVNTTSNKIAEFCVKRVGFVNQLVKPIDVCDTRCHPDNNHNMASPESSSVDPNSVSGSSEQGKTVTTLVQWGPKLFIREFDSF